MRDTIPFFRNITSPLLTGASLTFSCSKKCLREKRESFIKVQFHQCRDPSQTTPPLQRTKRMSREFSMSLLLRVTVVSEKDPFCLIISLRDYYPPTLPKRENMTPTPLSSYAVSKMAGEQTRDFTFENNVVQVKIRAMDSQEQDLFNVTCSQQINLFKLADMIMEITGLTFRLHLVHPHWVL
jgi:hypothetical protein